MCPTSSSPPGALKKKNVPKLSLLSFQSCREYDFKVTDYDELENLAEFFIFIWGTAPGGDEDIWEIKL
jgi:hypothetical protein